MAPFFFKLRHNKGGGEQGTHLGLLGLPWSDLTEETWMKTLTHLRLPGLKLGENSHNIRLICPSELRSI